MKKRRYTKDTPNKGFHFDITNFYGDWDNDGVMNGLDCYPKDKKRQDSRFKMPVYRPKGVAAMTSSKPVYRPNPIQTAKRISTDMHQRVFGSGTNFSKNPPTLKRPSRITNNGRPASMRPNESWKDWTTRRISEGKIQDRAKKFVPVAAGKHMIKRMPLKQAANKYSITSTGRGRYTAIKPSAKEIMEAVKPNFPKEYSQKIAKNPSLYKQPTPTPKSWSERAPPLKPGVKPDYRNAVIKKTNFVSKKDIVDLGAGYAANPYYKSINRYPAKVIVEKQLLKQKTGNVWGGKAPKLAPGYKPAYASKTIPREALADPSLRFGSGKQVVNPYYVPKSPNETQWQYNQKIANYEQYINTLN